MKWKFFPFGMFVLENEMLSFYEEFWDWIFQFAGSEMIICGTHCCKRAKLLRPLQHFNELSIFWKAKYWIFYYATFNSTIGNSLGDSHYLIWLRKKWPMNNKFLIKFYAIKKLNFLESFASFPRCSFENYAIRMYGGEERNVERGSNFIIPFACNRVIFREL